jgi:ketosteroid isomerase-like protein
MSEPTPKDPSATNLRIVQELHAAFRKGDVGAILALISPDVEWVEPDNLFNPAAGTRHGQAGFMEWLRIGKQSEEILVLEPRQFLAGDDTIAVVGYHEVPGQTDRPELRVGLRPLGHP